MAGGNHHSGIGCKMMISKIKNWRSNFPNIDYITPGGKKSIRNQRRQMLRTKTIIPGNHHLFFLRNFLQIGAITFSN